jgi:hypothetical protein
MAKRDKKAIHRKVRKERKTEEGLSNLLGDMLSFGAVKEADEKVMEVAAPVAPKPPKERKEPSAEMAFLFAKRASMAGSVNGSVASMKGPFFRQADPKPTVQRTNRRVTGKSKIRAEKKMARAAGFADGTEVRLAKQAEKEQRRQRLKNLY